MKLVIRVSRVVVAAALAMLPALVALFLISHYFAATLQDFCPAYDCDQYVYTREAGTFAAAGFRGGFYGAHGKTAVLGRFGPHGGAYAVAFGGLAKLFGGWRDWLAPAFNMGFVALALLAFARKTPIGGQAAMAFFLALFPPALIYLPLSYQDAPQYAVALALSICIGNLIMDTEKTRVRRRLIGALLAVFLASLTRPTWAVLFPGVLLAAASGRRKDILLSLAAGGVSLVAAYAAFALWASPWVHDVGVGKLLLSLVHGDFAPLQKIAMGNIDSILNFTDNRYHNIVLLLMLGGTALAMAFVGGDAGVKRRLLLLHICNILIPLATYLTIYNGSGYQLSRLMSAHFVLSMALTVRCQPQRTMRLVLVPVLAGCLALLPATLGQYTLFVRPAYHDFLEFRPRIAAMRHIVEPVLSVSLGASSPWLRTLAVPIGDAAALAYMAAPAAYGIELYVDAGLDKPLGAGFLLLDDAAHARLRPHMPLTLLEKTPSGGLYRNDVAFGFAKPGEARP